MDAEEVLFISFFEEGKEEGQDQQNTKKTSFRLSTKQGLFIFFHFHFFSTHEEKDKENYRWEDRGEVVGHSVTL